MYSNFRRYYQNVFTNVILGVSHEYRLMLFENTRQNLHSVPVL
jgi:hypothetical protein